MPSFDFNYSKYVAKKVTFTFSYFINSNIRTILHSQGSRWLQTNEVSWAGFSVIYIQEID